MDKLHIDIETFSSVDLKTSGVYAYAESPDFEILIMSYAFNNQEVQRINLALGEQIPESVLEAFVDPCTIKSAHNAMFERVCLKSFGYEIPIEHWECTAVKSAYCGLPFGLEAVSEALDLGDKSKSATGKKLIQFFSVPIKPTASNGYKTRNLPEDNLEKFDEYGAYCDQDVEAEREIDHRLNHVVWPKFERDAYILDQIINDRGIKVDIEFATNAYNIDMAFGEKAILRMKQITKLDNPNSPKQLISWLNEAQQDIKITSVAKDNLKPLRNVASGAVLDILELREVISKTSTTKYSAMIAAHCSDYRIRGLFQFYGANKTGRFAGRIVQLQNLPINRFLVEKNVDVIDIARKTIATGDLELAEIMYGNNIPKVLSELIRPALIAKDNHTFAVSDFSAIEARVLSWLANERWRMEVFATHGKIYEAAASKMFNVPIELVTKSSDYRAKAKNGELALGYQGGLGAMKRMGGESMGLSDAEMNSIVKIWRKANPCIVKLWDDINECAIESVVNKSFVETGYRGISFEYDGNIMKMNLPSGRCISYFDARLTQNRFGSICIAYKNIDQITKKWCDTETYGGKLVENAVQAISRDILVYSMLNLNKAGFEICSHVHDEVISEVEKDNGESKLAEMESIMKQEIPWAPELVLGAEGYITDYYKKD